MKLTHLLTGILLSCISFHVSAQSCVPVLLPDSLQWMPNGSVFDIEHDDSTIYLCGYFNEMYRTTGSFVAVDTAAQSAMPPGWPVVNGAVRCIEPDGSGGWYIGGLFTHVGDSARSNMAHILPNGQVSAWSSEITGAVEQIILYQSKLYLTGMFSAIGGQARYKLAAVSALSGQVDSWYPISGPGIGRYYIAHKDSLMYVSGAFSTLQNTSRAGLACFNLNTGLLTSWDPLQNPATGNLLCVVPYGSRVYVGGAFSAIAGQNRNSLAAFDAATGAILPWNPGVTHAPYLGIVNTITPASGNIYIGGLFSQAGGQSRQHLARIDTSSGLADSWDPWVSNSGNISARVYTIVTDGPRVYIGGSFDTVMGQSRNALALLDTAANLLPWDVRATRSSGAGQIAIQLDGNRILLGGGFKGIHALKRENLAAIGRYDGRLKDWAPSFNTIVRTVKSYGSKVYAFGEFSSVNGQPRQYLAAVDKFTGTLTSWAPTIEYKFKFLGNYMYHYDLEGHRDRVLIAGSFDTVNGQIQPYLAAVDTLTGALLPWDARIDAPVRTIKAMGNILYLSGRFTHIGGKSRPRLGSIYLNSAQPTSWAPVVDSFIKVAYPTFTLYGDSIYLLSDQMYEQYKGRVFNRFTTGKWLWPMNPGLYQYVLSTATDGRFTFMTGLFDSLGSVITRNMGMASRGTGTVMPWQVSGQGSAYPDAVTYRLDDKLIMADRFFSINTKPLYNLAWFRLPYTVPAAHITANLNDTCYSGPVSFTVTTSMPGQLSWTVNGINVGQHNDTFTYNPMDGDQVSCSLTLTVDSCSPSSTLFSNMIEMRLPTAPPQLSILGHSLLPADSLTQLIADVTGISGPFSVRWYHNGSFLATTQGPVLWFTTSPVHDTLQAVVVPDISCQDSAVSNPHIIRRPPAGISSTSLASIRVFPNPFHTELHLSGLQPGNQIVLYDLYGRQIVRAQQQHGKALLLTAGLATGSYLLTVYDREGHVLRRELVQKLQ